LDYDATLFNLGAVYKLTNAVNVYADFSQGFSVMMLALVFRSAPWVLCGFASRKESTTMKLGRGSTECKHLLAGFCNESNLGQPLIEKTPGYRPAPEHIYGLEAVVDAASPLNPASGDNG